MSGVHHNGIHARSGQGGHAFFGALAHAHGRTHTQFARFIARRIGKVELFGDVFHSDQPTKLKLLAHHQQTLQLMAVQKRLCLLGRCPLWHRNQTILWCHDLGHDLVIAGLKAEVAPRHDPDHPTGLDHRKARDAQLLGQLHHLAYGVVGGNHHGVT